MSQRPVYSSNRQRKRAERQCDKNREREKRSQRPRGSLHQQDYIWNAHGQFGALPRLDFNNQIGPVFAAYDAISSE